MTPAEKRLARARHMLREAAHAYVEADARWIADGEAIDGASAEELRKSFETLEAKAIHFVAVKLETTFGK